ncbi:type IV fimbrial biogenesis protein FimT [Alteromonadaceae bacterium 2753L.S.0a.02]|nr:type IV fimbrial biogenesis protein FimT [Alteromonadaceae bacterium 2753L.S.0a.02]
MTPSQRIRFQSGLTIPELMIGLLLFAIVSSLAVPSFQNVMRKNEMKAQLGLVTSSLAYARSEAVSRQKQISVCASTAGAVCDAGATWSSGWLVFVDENEDGSFDTDDGDELLKVVGRAGGQSTLEVESGGNTLRFTPEGENLAGEVKLALCAGDVGVNGDAIRSRTVTVSAVGSTRVARGADCVD